MGDFSTSHQRMIEEIENELEIKRHECELLDEEIELHERDELTVDDRFSIMASKVEWCLDEHRGANHHLVGAVADILLEAIDTHDYERVVSFVDIALEAEADGGTISFPDYEAYGPCDAARIVSLALDNNIMFFFAFMVERLAGALDAVWIWSLQTFEFDERTRKDAAAYDGKLTYLPYPKCRVGDVILYQEDVDSIACERVIEPGEGMWPYSEEASFEDADVAMACRMLAFVVDRCASPVNENDTYVHVATPSTLRDASSGRTSSSKSVIRVGGGEREPVEHKIGSRGRVTRRRGGPRRGHFRNQPCGKGGRDRKRIWIEATWTRGVGMDDDESLGNVHLVRY